MGKIHSSRLAAALVVAMAALDSEAFVNQQHAQHRHHSHQQSTATTAIKTKSALHLQFWNQECVDTSAATINSNSNSLGENVQMAGKLLSTFCASAALVASFALPAFAENELSDIYGGKGFDSSLVDQTCLVDRCGTQAKACLADDPSCRKGLTCTAKCLGDNSCITGCMARYGNKNLDNLLKCTIEDHECIKIAILPGGADKFGDEPKPPAPTVRNFDYKSMEGTWYKVVGFNPNYDCYACQRNTFEIPSQEDPSTNFVSNTAAAAGTTSAATQGRLNMGVEFSMPHLLPDGSPLPPRNVKESISVKNDAMFGSKSIGLNEYQTNEVMLFDNVNSPTANLVMNKGQENEASYSRTAHSEGEMFGLSKLLVGAVVVHTYPIFTTCQHVYSQKQHLGFFL